MSNYESNRIATLVRFLANVKEEILRSGKDGRMIGNCGYLTAATYLDGSIATLLEQQTRIEDLESRLNAELEENREYRRLAGDLEDLYPQIEDMAAGRDNTARNKGALP